MVTASTGCVERFAMERVETEQKFVKATRSKAMNECFNNVDIFTRFNGYFPEEEGRIEEVVMKPGCFFPCCLAELKIVNAFCGLSVQTPTV